MATLSPAPASTVRAIEAAREAAHQLWDSYGLSMSELGSECDRALWYSFRWASAPEVLTGQKLRLFETGHIEEDRMITDLRRIKGVTVEAVDPETGKQWKVYSHGGHVRGKLDGEAIGLPEAPATIHVVECKSHNDKNFKELVKKGLHAAKPAHWFQCQKYMELRSRTRCLYIAVNKNTDELYSERLRFDPLAIAQLNVRLERIIGSNQAPPRIAEGADKWPCIFCKHKAVCHRETLGRQHCRTCLHSTPIVDHADTAGPWVCEKHGKTRTMDEQRAGCHGHLFLPDTVNGEQIDAGDDFVVYELCDGSRWENRERRDTNKVRYWFHPESDSLWTTNDGSQPENDGLVEELSATEYATAEAYYAGLK